MQHSLLTDLNILVIAESALTVGALAACLRAAKNTPVPAMRDYLVVRTANALAAAIVLLWPGESLLLSVRPSLAALLYYFWFWIVSFVLLFLEMRVAAGAMAVFFRDLPGLQGLLRLASRWLAITGVIVMMPLLLTIAANFNNRAYLPLFRLWWYAFSALQMIPVIFALLVGMVRKVRWKSRMVAILIGFVFEPFVHLAGPWAWTSRTSMLNLENIAGEIACCAAVALWTICFVVPEPATSLARPTPAMLNLDELARGAIHQRHPHSRAEFDAQRGAQPWPKYRRDP
jgi:hypothetical protein